MTYCGVLPLPDNWETDMENSLLKSQSDKARRKVYICSPCRAESSDGVYGNMMATRYYMYYAYKEMGVFPCAPHAYLPVILNDCSPHERNLALGFGKELLSLVSERLVCGQMLTDGMRGEILKAVEMNIPVFVYSPGLFGEIKEITNSPIVQYDDKHIPLIFNATELFK